MSRARSALRARRLELHPQNPKNHKGRWQVVFAVFVVFAGIVDLFSQSVIKGKAQKDLTSESRLC